MVWRFLFAVSMILPKLKRLVFVTHRSYSSYDYERLEPNCTRHLHIEDVTHPIEYLALVDMHEMNVQAALIHHYHSGSRLSKPLVLGRSHPLGKELKSFPSKQLPERLTRGLCQSKTKPS